MLVNTSVGNSKYDLALQFLACMREQCKIYGLGGVFNDNLKSLCREYKDDVMKGGFWRRVAESGVTLLVSPSEVKRGGASEEEAAEFLK